MAGDMGHMGGLINPLPVRGQHRAGFANTGGSPKPRKRAPCQKNKFGVIHKIIEANLVIVHRYRKLFELFSHTPHT